MCVSFCLYFRCIWFHLELDAVCLRLRSLYDRGWDLWVFIFAYCIVVCVVKFVAVSRKSCLVTIRLLYVLFSEMWTDEDYLVCLLFCEIMVCDNGSRVIFEF